jgi:hypothetical protein
MLILLMKNLTRWNFFLVLMIKNDKKIFIHVKILEYYRKQTLSEHDFHFVIFFQMKNKIT